MNFPIDVPISRSIADIVKLTRILDFLILKSLFFLGTSEIVPGETRCESSSLRLTRSFLQLCTDTTTLTKFNDSFPKEASPSYFHSSRPTPMLRTKPVLSQLLLLLRLLLEHMFKVDK